MNMEHAKIFVNCYRSKDTTKHRRGLVKDWIQVFKDYPALTATVVNILDEDLREVFIRDLTLV